MSTQQLYYEDINFSLYSFCYSWIRDPDPWIRNPDPDPDPHENFAWIRIRIRIKIHADPQP